MNAIHSTLLAEQEDWTPGNKGNDMTPAKLAKLVQRDRGDVDGIPAVTPLEYFGSKVAMESNLKGENTGVAARGSKRPRRKYRCKSNGMIFDGAAQVIDWLDNRFTPQALHSAIRQGYRLGGHQWERIDESASTTCQS